MCQFLHDGIAIEARRFYRIRRPAGLTVGQSALIVTAEDRIEEPAAAFILVTVLVIFVVVLTFLEVPRDETRRPAPFPNRKCRQWRFQGARRR